MGLVLVALQTVTTLIAIFFIRVALFIDSKTKITLFYAILRGLSSLHHFFVFNYFKYIGEGFGK